MSDVVSPAHGVLNSTKRAAVVMMSIAALGEKPSQAALATLAVVLVGGAGYGVASGMKKKATKMAGGGGAGGGYGSLSEPAATSAASEATSFAFCESDDEAGTHKLKSVDPWLERRRLVSGIQTRD